MYIHTAEILIQMIPITLGNFFANLKPKLT